MPNYTTNINLEKPLQTENYNIDVHNGNSDKLDTVIKALQDLTATLQTKTTALETNTTASAILTALKTVDGAGSGLDADLLDGQHSDYFARSGFGGEGEWAQIVNNALDIKNENGNYINGRFKIFNSTDMPNLNWFILEQTVLNDSYVNLKALDVIDSNAKWIENRKIDGTWQGWKEIGGGSMKTIQRGTATKTNNISLVIPINTINPAKSICHLYASGLGSSTSGFQTLSFTLNSNNISLPAFSSSTDQHSFTWQVIEYN